MAERSFAVYLGGGLYLDSNADLIHGAVPDVPVYAPPSGLPFDPDKISKTFEGVKKGLPDPSDPKSVEKFKNWGLDDKTIALLGKLGEFAGVAAAIATRGRDPRRGREPLRDAQGRAVGRRAASR